MCVWGGGVRACVSVYASMFAYVCVWGVGGRGYVCKLIWCVFLQGLQEIHISTKAVTSLFMLLGQ